jgi:hypothetical protein
MLKTQKEIHCLDIHSHLTLLALAIEIGGTTDKPLAKIVKAYGQETK